MGYVLDPVFFLHHAQLDRLWWKWQQVSPENAASYNGPREHQSKHEADLDDLIRMGEFVNGVKVEDVMSTESELLCYRYS